MTELTITPKTADKTARFRGTVAAGEHVAVTIKGGAEWLGDDNGAHLSLRVIDFVTGRTLALFPRPEETLEDGEEQDEWGTAGEDDADLICNLNLNTDRMVNAARHMLRVPVLFVMGAKDDENPAATRTLYFRDRYEVEFWPERVGDDTPYDLDKWPKQIDEWTDLVAEFGTRLTTAETSISQAEGRVNAAIIAIPQTVATAVAQSNSGKADKVANATNGNLAALDANGNLDDSGKKPSDFADASQFTNHKNDTNIHIKATERSTWNAKYDKPSGGIPKSDLAETVRTSLGKADTAIQEHQSLAAYVNGGVYDGDAKKILLKHDSVTVAEIDATAFIKDGMISEVKIVGDNLVIVFNADAEKESISIPLTQIFNPANFYDKTAADNRFVQKESGKGLVAVDAALSATSENPVQNKVVTAALNGKASAAQGAKADAALSRAEAVAGFTEWVCNPAMIGDERVYIEWDGNYWIPTNGGGKNGVVNGNATSTNLAWEANDWWGGVPLTATRTRLPTMADIPTDNTQLTNGAGYATTAEMIAALAPKADASSLPYALVTPTTRNEANLLDSIFPFSCTAQGMSVSKSLSEKSDLHYSSGVISTDLGEPFGEVPLFTVGSDGTFLEEFLASNITFNGVTPTANVTPVLGFTEVVTLTDRAINAVSLSAAATLVFPAQTAGKARDFVVRLTLVETNDVVPSVTFPADVAYETEGGEWPDLTEAGTYIVRLTEVPKASESETARFFLQCSSAVADATPPSAGGGQ